MPSHQEASGKWSSERQGSGGGAREGIPWSLCIREWNSSLLSVRSPHTFNISWYVPGRDSCLPAVPLLPIDSAPQAW